MENKNTQLFKYLLLMLLLLGHSEKSIANERHASNNINADINIFCEVSPDSQFRVILKEHSITAGYYFRDVEVGNPDICYFVDTKLDILSLMHIKDRLQVTDMDIVGTAKRNSSMIQNAPMIQLFCESQNIKYHYYLTWTQNFKNLYFEVIKFNMTTFNISNTTETLKPCYSK